MSVCLYVCMCLSVCLYIIYIYQHVYVSVCLSVCCSDFRCRSELFLRSFDHYLSTTDESDTMLNK